MLRRIGASLAGDGVVDDHGDRVIGARRKRAPVDRELRVLRGRAVAALASCIRESDLLAVDFKQRRGDSSRVARGDVQRRGVREEPADRAAVAVAVVARAVIPRGT